MKNNFPKEINIGDRLIGEGHPCYIIAEIGANFDQSLDKAKILIEKAKECGADSVKFQSFISEKIVSKRGFKSMVLKGVHGTWEKPIDEVFREAELPRDWHYELKEFSDKMGIHFSTSPYDYEAIELCGELDLPYIKIGSGEITWLEALDHIARKNKPIFLSTGDATLSEIDEAIRTIEATGNLDLVLLQCITNYPSKIESANIRVLDSYKLAFDILVGYSDHSPGIVVPLGAVSLGACVIEKHFTINKHDKGPDHPHSMEPEEFKQMVKAIRELETALGSTRKIVVDEESETVIVQRRSLYARKTLKIGERIEDNDIVELRPQLGILPKYKNYIIGKKMKRIVEADEPIRWSDID